MSPFYHLSFEVSPGCAGQPCSRCIRLNMDSTDNAAAMILSSIPLSAQIDTTLPSGDDVMNWEPTPPRHDVSLELEDFTQWAMSIDEVPTLTEPSAQPLTTPSHDHTYVHDDYTPSYNNPFFEDFHAYNPRGGLSVVDYY